MSTQVTIPDTPSVNVLPVDPNNPPREAEKQRVERRKNYGSLLEFLKNTCKRIESEDKPENLKILAQQNKCQAYYDDRQYGKSNDKGEWQDYPYDQNEFRPVDNKYKEQLDKLQMEMSRSFVDLPIEPADETDSRMVEAAKFAKSRIDANRKRLFTQHPEFIIAENNCLLLKTITYRYTYFDKDAEESPTERRPVFQKQAVGEEKSLTVCAVCGMPRQDDEPIDKAQQARDDHYAQDGAGLEAVSYPPQGIQSPALPAQTPDLIMSVLNPCPYCGSQSTKTLSTSPTELELPSGTEEVRCGLPRVVHADPTMVQVSLNARMMSIPSTPFIVWTQMVERGKLEPMFPDSVIPSSDSDTGQQAQYRRENETAVSNATDSWNTGSTDIKGGEQFQKLKFKLIWLDSWIYGDYQDDKPTKLPDGRVLPPNVPLIKFFPKGMCLAKVGDTILKAWNEDKNKKWSVCVYGLREHAFHGSGTNALIPIQITINDLLGYRIGNIYYNTFTREFIRKGSIEGDTLPRLDKACLVTNLDENQKIVGGAYDRAPGNPLPAEVSQLSEEQAGSLQEQAGTSSLSPVGTQAQQQGLGTATGIAYMRDLSVGRMGPNLMLKAAMEVETAFQILECEQANYSKQHLFALAGLKPDRPSGNLGYTAEGVEAFLNSDIRADFNITPAQGSWMPSTEQEKKADALAFADAASKVQDPEVLSNVAKALKQPMSIGGWNATEHEAARRIEEFGKIVLLLEKSGYTEDTDALAQVVLDSATSAMLDEEMDNHPAFIQFYKDWWVSDESVNASSLLKRAVKLRTIEHKDAMTSQVTDANARTIETQIPSKVAEVLSNQVDAQQEQSNQADAANQQTQAEMTNREHEAQVNQTQGQSELENQAASNQLAAQDREHALMTKVADREHQATMNQ